MENTIGRVYLITNQVNGKRYIGCTTQTISARWKGHYNQGSLLLGQDIKEFGRNNFSVEIVFESLVEEALQIEKYLIQRYLTKAPNGYNIRSGGDMTTVLGTNLPLEVCTRMSASKIGNKNSLGFHPSEETRAIQSAKSKGNQYAKGHRWSEEEKVEISERAKGNKSRTGQKASEETRARMRLARVGLKYSPEARANITAGQKKRWAKRRELLGL